VAPQRFEVSNQMLGRIIGCFAIRRGAPAAALVEHDDAVIVGVEKAAVRRRGPRTRAAMQENRRRSFGIAGHLPIHCMVAVQIEHAAFVWLDFRVELILGRTDIHAFNL